MVGIKQSIGPLARFGLVATLGWALATMPSLAAGRATIWDLPLGKNLATMPAPARFGLLACGSNGGPPLQHLSDWSGFSQCAPEADGLHEVYVEYDQTAGKAGLAAGTYVDPALVGTAEAYFPVVASALFDESGTLEGIRLVTDARPDAAEVTSLPRLRPRGEHYLLGGYLAKRFGIEPQDCEDALPERGETPVIGQFVKQLCSKTEGDVTYTIEQRYLRKRGQHDVDPDTGQLTQDQFVSWTRAEVRLDQERSDSK